MAEPPRSGDLIWHSSNAAFYKLAALPLLVELLLVWLAVRAAQSVPVGGDPTLRYVSIGVPGFWAVLLAILLAVGMFMFTGQSVSLTRRAFIYRRGRFSVLIPWEEAVFVDSSNSGGRSFLISSGRSSVQIRAFLFPAFKEMEASITARMKRRETYY